MIPHERSLVQRLKNKPFALLGVDSDPRARYLAAVKEGEITWRNWLDGGTDGPIAKQWDIDGWPTVYVIDSKGVIRYKDVEDGALDEAVETLLKEMGEPVAK